MKRTQLWCDSCGRLIQDKHVGNGEDHPADINNTDRSWQLWSPRDNDDQICCSLECIIAVAQILINRRDMVANNENR